MTRRHYLLAAAVASVTLSFAAIPASAQFGPSQGEFQTIESCVDAAIKRAGSQVVIEYQSENKVSGKIPAKGMNFMCNYDLKKYAYLLYMQ